MIEKLNTNLKDSENIFKINEKNLQENINNLRKHIVELENKIDEHLKEIDKKDGIINYLKNNTQNMKQTIEEK